MSRETGGMGVTRERPDDSSRDERGQIYTLEAFTAAVVLLASLAFALGMVGGPSGADPSSPASQESEIAEGVLAQAVANQSVRKSLLYWNENEQRFREGDEEYYVADTPNEYFLGALSDAFSARNVVFEVTLVYAHEGEIHRQPLVEGGTPTSGARYVSRTVTLYDRDVLYDSKGATNQTLAASAFWMPDTSPGPVYGVVEVEVVVWQV